MAKNLINKYVWLVETIYKAKRITFEELNEKWLENDLSEGVELALRTFHKWRIAVEEMFGLVIECERRGGYHYHIANADELKSDCVRNWLMSTLSVSNLLIDNQHMKDRILLEDIPSGHEFLTDIIEAMKGGYSLNMTYQSYWREKSNTFVVEPYCVKLFRQRWYMVARSPYLDRSLVYSLDRILELETDKKKRFKLPRTFDASVYFDGCFGVIAGDGTNVENVKLKVSVGQANYLRSLPLHHSQQEILQTEEYSIFELRIRPTFDFYQEILRNGEDVEILEPEWLRKEIAGIIEKMWNKYSLSL